MQSSGIFSLPQEIIFRTSSIIVLMVSTLVAVVIAAPIASADEDPVNSRTEDCGWSTCTLYWSVTSTKEINDRYKGIIASKYGRDAGALALGLGAAGTVSGGALAVPAATIGALTGIGTLYKIGEFDLQVSQAAEGGRCLIFKYQKAAKTLGWWGSVSASNKNCQG